MIMSEGGNAFCKDLCRCSFYRYVNKMCVWMCMDVYGMFCLMRVSTLWIEVAHTWSQSSMKMMCRSIWC